MPSTSEAFLNDRFYIDTLISLEFQIINVPKNISVVCSVQYMYYYIYKTILNVGKLTPINLHSLLFEEIEDKKKKQEIWDK